MAGELVGFLQALKDGGYLKDTLTEWQEMMMSDARFRCPTFNLFDKEEHFVIKMEENMEEEMDIQRMTLSGETITTTTVPYIPPYNAELNRSIQDTLRRVDTHEKFIEHCYLYGINSAERAVANGGGAISEDDRRQLDFLLKSIYERLQ